MKPGMLPALICIVFWSMVPIASRMGQSNLDHYQFLFWSNALSVIVVWLAALLKNKTGELWNYDAKSLLRATGLGFLGCCFYYLCLYYGYANGAGLEILVIQFTWPIQISALSIFLLNETINWKKGGALALGFLGVVIVITKFDWSALSAGQWDIYLIVLIGAFAFALFSVLSKKFKMEPYSSTILFFLSATVFSCVSMMAFSGFALPDGHSLLPVLVNGALINGITYILWIDALSKVEASKLAPLVYITPMLSAVWIILVFQEPFYPAYYLGFFLALLAGVLAV